MRIVVAGPSGAGKTVVGRALAERLGVAFVDADGLHPAANVERMRAGAPLDDEARAPWLAAVGAALAGAPHIVIACSALARRYRDRLRAAAPDVVFVALDVPAADLEARMRRRDHFMPPALLPAQLTAWEPLDVDEAGGTVPGTGTIAVVVARAQSVLAVALAAERPERSDDDDEAAGGEKADGREHEV